MPTSRRTPSRAAVTDAAEVLSRLLAAVEAREIEADTPQARRLVRRIEGAQGAWEAESGGMSPGIRVSGRI
jgi:hypothetical protein